MPTNRRKYDEEFKKRAVRMSYSSERPVTEVAKSLGITSNMIYIWRKKYTPEGDKTKMAQQQEDVSGLRSRIAELEEENYILKKASAFFAKARKMNARSTRPEHISRITRRCGGYWKRDTPARSAPP